MADIATSMSGYIPDEIRKRAGEYFASRDFDAAFLRLHPHSRRTLLLAGLFLPLFFQFAAAKAAWKKLAHGDFHSAGLRRRYARIAKSGQALFTYVLVCNNQLQYTPGAVAPALVVGNFNKGKDDHQILQMQEKLAHMALGLSVEPKEQKIAKLLEDLDYTFQRRRHFNGQGVQIIAFDLMIAGEFLPTETLQFEVVPCLAEPGRNGLIAMIPAFLFRGVD